MSSAASLEVLHTDRLLLRRLAVHDAPVVRHLWTERDPRVPEHRRVDAAGRPTVDDVAARIRAEEGEPDLALLAVERRGAGDLIGYCGLTAHGNGTSDEPELAFELLRATHGRGYATEAARAVVGWADAAGFRRLWAGVWDWNVASRRVLEKVGFRETDRVVARSAHGVSLLTVREVGAASVRARTAAGDGGSREVDGGSPR